MAGKYLYNKQLVCEQAVYTENSLSLSDPCGFKHFSKLFQLFRERRPLLQKFLQQQLKSCLQKRAIG